MIVVARIGVRECGRILGLRRMGALVSDCRQHTCGAWVPLPSRRGRLPAALQAVLVERLLHYHRQVNGCDCDLVWGKGYPPRIAQ